MNFFQRREELEAMSEAERAGLFFTIVEDIMKIEKKLNSDPYKPLEDMDKLPVGIGDARRRLREARRGIEELVKAELFAQYSELRRGDD